MAPADLTGIGVGWRPQMALAIERYPALGFVEVLAEDLNPRRLPPALLALRERGVPVIPHCVGLSLGSADAPDSRRLDHLAELALALEAPLVSDHLAFVRGGGLETGHLLPLPRTEEALEIVIENVRMARAALPVPLALENIAALVEWPESRMSEAEFPARVLEATGAGLLLDVSNLFANGVNHAAPWEELLDRIPADRIAYAHVGGGCFSNGIYHDTHTHPVPAEVLTLLREVTERCGPLPVLLERDGDFPGERELHAELDSIRAALGGTP